MEVNDSRWIGEQIYLLGKWNRNRNTGINRRIQNSSEF